jgi:hypothetical protein
MDHINKIYDLMSDKGFQEPRTGNLFFPAYVYTYDPVKEYEIRRQIDLLADKLKRPNHYLDCLIFNVYHELINYLNATMFAGSSLFDQVLEQEKDDPIGALAWVRDEIKSDAFIEFLAKKVNAHFHTPTDKRVYLIIHGFGSIFPYLRASELLKRMESLVKDFKLILFYPGKYEESRYSLFGILNDDNMYRANHLNLLLV